MAAVGHPPRRDDFPGPGGLPVRGTVGTVLPKFYGDTYVFLGASTT
jgi:hypothetical protein